MNRQVRVGIDVGGTFTKAVAIDSSSHEIIGKSEVLTTHKAAEGVAKGVVTAFLNCIRENNIKPEEVVFLAHSTTQATNALLEGDVAQVGIVAVGKKGLEGMLVKSQTKMGDIPLGAGKFIKTHHTFLDKKTMTDEILDRAVAELNQKGAEVVVATQSFGVDNSKEEEAVIRAAVRRSMPGTAAFEISKLYGLTVRTRSAVVNASILPKMVGTADSTEKSIRETNIQAPLMIMRGDGGVMSIDEMRKRPVLTMLSGPTASVVGALMYLRASDGIYFEVGGTSTNIGVIKNGRPTIKYAQIGSHKTYINSLDVRVLGVAGGSMVRVSNGKIVDVGPRSAHIAGLDYAAFTPEEEIVNPQVEFIKPREGDPDDYIAIRLAGGKRITITNTCAANVLGLIQPGWHAKGNVESCRKAIGALAKVLNLSIEETARQILAKATANVIQVVKDLILEYKLDSDQVTLVGCGGGAGTLLPFTADQMKLPYQIPQNAEVISSIGAALAMVRDSVERIIPNPTQEDIQKIKMEAKEAVIKIGADPSSIEVNIEIDTQTQRVRAIALGATELKTTDLLKACTLEEATGIAAKSMNVAPETVKCEGTTDGIFVFTSQVQGKKSRLPVRVVDKKGFIKVQRSDSLILKTTVAEAVKGIESVWDDVTIYTTDCPINPDLFVALGGHVVDLASMPSREQAVTVALSELTGLPGDEPVIIVGVHGFNGLN